MNGKKIINCFMCDLENDLNICVKCNNKINFCKDYILNEINKYDKCIIKNNNDILVFKKRNEFYIYKKYHSNISKNNLIYSDKNKYLENHFNYLNNTEKLYNAIIKSIL